jgi:3-hydroxy-9,10-secoandrosta-1,3,5(10)-triene-9,17-dione monooxygenase reductase component
MPRTDADPMDPFGPAESVDGEALRSVMRRVASPVAVVTAVGAGEMRGMTIDSLTSVSLDPPLISFTVARDAQMHPVLTEAESFAVHVVGVHQIRLCERFAEPDRRSSEQFAGVLYGFDVDGNPVLGGALAVLRCRHHALVTAGDHTIVIGRVAEIRQHEGGAPLLYYNRSYRSVSGEI